MSASGYRRDDGPPPRALHQVPSMSLMKSYG
jgi:hypothetical protein